MAERTQPGAIKPDGKPTRMKAAVSELRSDAVRKLMPIAETIADAVEGAKEDAVSDMETKLNTVRADAKGAKEAAASAERKVDAHAQKVDADVAEVKKLADEVKDIAGEISSRADHLESQAGIAVKQADAATNTAKEVNAKLDGLVAKDETDKEQHGADALAVTVRKVERLPHLAVAAVASVVKAEVPDVDEKGREIKTEKKGAELISYLVGEVSTVKVAAGRAVEEAQHAAELVQSAKNLLEDLKETSEGTVSALESKLSDATSKLNAILDEIPRAFGRIDDRFATILEVAAGVKDAGEAAAEFEQPVYQAKREGA